MFSCVCMKLSAAAQGTASSGRRRRREEALQNFFFSLKRLWSSSVTLSEEGDPTRRVKKTQGDITVWKKSIPSSVFVSAHERGKKDAFVFVLCI